MNLLPPIETPLNQHSLLAIENWLGQLGAKKSSENPSLWIWKTSNWAAEIILGRDELCVVWIREETRSQCCFSYGLSREDVEVAINQGP